MHAKRFAGFEVPITAVAPLLLALAVQAVLLFSNIGLLTIWTDETFTYETVIRPAAQIVAILQDDIHPPLYYLLVHAWIQLPLPGDLLERIRAFSAVWTLIATILIDRLWLERLRPSRRYVALALWTLSPAVLLYGRMGRSYMMQTALAVVAVSAAWRFLRRPGARPLAVSAVALIFLLYTHYLPGIAITAAFSIAIGIEAAKKRSGRIAGLLVLWLGLIAGAYTPWLVQMSGAIARWRLASGFSSRYLMTGSAAAEQVVKLGYGVVAFIAGECFPIWAVVSVPIILLVLLLSLRRLWRVSRGLMFVITVAALIGYLGVARWASYPFIPARLLWLLPFVLIWIAISPGARPALRTFAISLLLVSNLASLVSYFSQQNFRNKTYVVPLRDIANLIRLSSRPGDSLVLLDAYNADAVSLVYYLRGAVPSIVTGDEGTAAQAFSRVGDSHYNHIWLVRNTHDVSPGHTITAIESAACEGREQRRMLYVPYEPWERAAMRLVRIEPAPSHFYQVTECLK